MQDHKNSTTGEQNFAFSNFDFFTHDSIDRLVLPNCYEYSLSQLTKKRI